MSASCIHHQYVMVSYTGSFRLDPFGRDSSSGDGGEMESAPSPDLRKVWWDGGGPLCQYQVNIPLIVVVPGRATHPKGAQYWHCYLLYIFFFFPLLIIPFDNCHWWLPHWADLLAQQESQITCVCGCCYSGWLATSELWPGIPGHTSECEQSQRMGLVCLVSGSGDH